jgi:(1->4)-alpha-D-glucan 1-alpha-D-glucosylmutase
MTRAERVPSATYRLQLRREFPLAAARAAVPYLRLLGVSDLYLSPLHAARLGSVHGYDVVDHARLNPELGDEGALRHLLDDVHASGLGVLLDVVPNHMCIADDANLQWSEVLEDGRESPSAATFDVDWEPPKPELVGKVLLPFLEDQYGRVLEGGLSVGFETGRFFLALGPRRLPLGAESWHHLLEPTLEALRPQLPVEDPALLEVESILRAVVQTLPSIRVAGASRFVEYRHEKEAIKHRLAALVETSGSVQAAISQVLSLINGTRGDPGSFDRLERLLDQQSYRLANWRVAAHEINYRRFFDINDLAAVRVEDPRVFASVHALPFEIAAHPAFTGFRIDHVDGLSDPEQYLTNLAEGWRQRRPGNRQDASRPFVVVEKILGREETLPPGWAADGTTGYDFIRALGDLFTWAEAQPELRAIASRFGSSGSFDEVAHESKRLVLQTSLAAELTVLSRRLDRVSEQHRYTRDFTLNHLQAALGEIIACFPVYRTYIRRDDPDVSQRDAAVVRGAVAAARRRNPLINSSLFDFIESVLLCEPPPGLDQAQLDERRTLVTRLQQLTGPVMAKGTEDTAFYRYLPLIAANEVGCDPGQLGRSVPEVHRALRTRQEISPHTLSATATHDTKRGEDARARLYVLSEVPEAWSRAAGQWSVMNAAYKTEVDGLPAPDAAEEYLLYQTLVGAWPLEGWGLEPDFADRIRGYMTKARHEAKAHTSWINPHPAYEAAAESFVDALLDLERSGAFLQSVESFTRTIVLPGLCTALSQLVLKVAAPGAPDFFQGAELWDFSLVDPDNRRLVDFERRHDWLRRMLAEVEAGGVAPIRAWFEAPDDGRIKLWITAAGLRLRRARRQLFERGGYVPLATRGKAAEHVFAFARTDGDDAVLAIVGRLFGRFFGRFLAGPATSGADHPIGAAWGDTRLILPAGLGCRRFRNGLTGHLVMAEGESLSLSSVFEHLPVALLETMS